MTIELRRAALARIRAPQVTAKQVSHWDVPKECPSGTVARGGGTGGTNGTVGTLGTGGTAFRPIRLDTADVAERAAYIEKDGNIPGVYAEEFARLQQTCPAGVPEARWRQFINDGGVFLDRWGKHALRLGWTVADLFGLDPAAPLARYDRMGILWLVKGGTVLAVNSAEARLSSGQVFRRAQPYTGT